MAEVSQKRAAFSADARAETWISSLILSERDILLARKTKDEIQSEARERDGVYLPTEIVLEHQHGILTSASRKLGWNGPFE